MPASEGISGKILFFIIINLFKVDNKRNLQVVNLLQ